MLTGPAYPAGSRGGSFLVSQLAALGFSCSEMQPSNLCLHHLLPSSRASVSTSKFPSSVKDTIIGLESILLQRDLRLTWLYTQRPSFQIGLHSQLRDTSNQPYQVPVWKIRVPSAQQLFLDKTFTLSSMLCGFSLHPLGVFHCYFFYPPFYGTGLGVSIEQEWFESLGRVLYMRR